MIMHPIRSNSRENFARIFIFLMTLLIIMAEMSEFLTWAKKIFHERSFQISPNRFEVESLEGCRELNKVFSSKNS